MSIAMKLFRVIKPGFFTTVQDLGRHGFLKYGVPISGAMDDLSLRFANMLVGNNLGDACLELTMLGPELEALHDAQIAVAGGDISVQINEQDAQMWQTLRVKTGDVVSLGRIQAGCRSYLSVRGGVNVPIVLGSRSTYVRCEIGGIQGRQLKAGDEIEEFDVLQPLGFRLSVPRDFVPDFGAEANVRVVLGPQLKSFTEKGVETFLSNPYMVTIEADRMGYRLEGPAIERGELVDTISDAILPGAVQVPASGKPIITMCDAQTTGGYPKIAAVLSSDMHILGQAKPNNWVRFQRTTLSEAHRALVKYRDKIRTIESKLLQQRTSF